VEDPWKKIGADMFPEDIPVDFHFRVEVEHIGDLDILDPV
jgi:hypothetical protein